MIVLDPPERGPRVYKREWKASAWRGSLDEIVGAVQAAVDEIHRQGIQYVSEVSILEYKDGSSETINSLDALREMVGNADPAEVKNLSVRLAGGTPSVLLRGTADKGLSVTAEGSEAFAAGMVATFKSRLAGGAEAGEMMVLVPIRPFEWFLLALSPVLFVGALVFLFVQSRDDDVVFFLLMAGLVGGAPLFVGFGAIADNNRTSNPVRFVLVPEGDQFPDEGEAKDGPVWRAKDWFERHPFIKLVLTLLVGGLIGALIAQGLDGLLS
ncbi:MAG TPA: hypothetical protein VIT89_03400 [Solirubrobacterales bacterium]